MVTAVFNCSDYAETKEIWQWNYGQVLRIQGLSLPAAVEIHFALQEAGGESVTRIGVTKDGVTDVTIPDSLLENDGTTQRYSIYAFIYLTDTNSGQTIKKITIPVKTRPKPQPFDTPEDAQLFREAIKAVNDAADRAGASEKLAEGWAHGREDMPERAQDNAMYYAGKASEDARQTAADRETVKEMVDSVSDIEQQVETIKGYADQAAKSQESSEDAAKAARESAAAAELSRQQAGQYATDAAKSASDASDSADQASSHATKAGQAYTSTVELAQQVQTDINQAGDTQVQAINSAGATQVQAIKSEGAKQVQAVQDAAQEIVVDREQIKTNKEDIADLKDQILPLAIKATSDKAEILDITDSADFKMQGFNLYGRTDQVQTEGYQLFDGRFEKDKVINTDGTVSTYKGRSTTDFIRVDPNTQYSGFTAFLRRAFYDGNKKLISYNDNNTTTDTTPSNCAYVRFNFINDSVVMFNAGSTAKPWEPYTGGFPSPRPQMRSKNLANPDDIVIGGLTEGAGLELVANNRIRTGYIPVTAGASYKYRTIYAVSNAHMYNTDKTKVGNYSSSVPIPEGIAYIRMSFGRIDNSDFTIDDLANFKDAFMFNEGETALPYEPYLIPEWPQPINHAGRLNEETGKYEVQVKVTGKNLLDIEKVADRDNWKLHKNLSGYFNYPVFVGKGNLVTISYPEKLPLGHGFYLAVCLMDNGNIVGWLAHTTNADLNYTKLSYTATTDYIYITAHGDGIENIKKYFSNLQVEYGTAATPYEPYKEQSITLTSDRPLTKWDCLDRRDGVWGWVYKGKSKVIDGSETYYSADEYVGHKTSNIFTDIADLKIASSIPLNYYVNKLPFLPLSFHDKNDGKIGFCNASNQLHLRLDNYFAGVLKTDTKATVVSKMRNYLKAEYDKGSPFIFWYETELETFTPLSDPEQQALNALVTYYPTTIITNNVNAQMQAQYVADPANYIANHYVSKEDTQTIMQRISNIETAMLKL